jgi:hypothetical protein
VFSVHRGLRAVPWLPRSVQSLSRGRFSSAGMSLLF